VEIPNSAAISEVTAQKPAVHLITILYNSEPSLRDFLDSLLGQDMQDWKLVVVDNASGDAALAMVEAVADPRIEIIRNATNNGFAKAANQGLRFAFRDGADFAILINNDTVFDGDFLRRFVEARMRLGADVIAPRIMNTSGPEEAWYAGGHFERGWILANVHESFDPTDARHWRHVEYASGCCLGMSRRALEKTGLFDESFFVYWEDADLCLRLAAAGIPIHYVRDPFMRHEGGAASGGEHTPARHRLFYRSQMQFLRKHCGMRQAIGAMIRILLREKGRPGVAWTDLKVIARAMLAGLQAPMSGPARLD
jgi:GT2 family glycosyltransferase